MNNQNYNEKLKEVEELVKKAQEALDRAVDLRGSIVVGNATSEYIIGAVYLINEEPYIHCHVYYNDQCLVGFVCLDDGCRWGNPVTRDKVYTLFEEEEEEDTVVFAASSVEEYYQNKLLPPYTVNYAFEQELCQTS